MTDQCDELLQGTGVTQGVPCAPTPLEVLDYCLSSEGGGHYPEKQPRPQAFASSIYRHTGIKLPSGLPCSELACPHFERVRQLDLYCFPGCAVLLLSTLMCSCWAESAFHGFKSRKLQERSLEMQATKETSR